MMLAGIFAFGLIFLKQSFATSIGTSGQDVGSGLTGIGSGLTGMSSGITDLINSIFSPISGLISTFSGFFGGLSSNGSRPEPQPTGREDRKTPTEKVRSSDTSTITWSSGTSATVPTLSAEAKSYYRKLGVNVS